MAFRLNPFFKFQLLISVALLIGFASCSSSKPLEAPKETASPAPKPEKPISPVAQVWQTDVQASFDEIQRALLKTAPDSIRQKAVRADTTDIFIGDFVSLTFLSQSVLRTAVPKLDSLSTFLLKTLPTEPDSLAKATAALMLETVGKQTAQRLDSITRASYTLFDTLARSLQARYQFAETWTAADAAFAASNLVKCRELIRLQALLAERTYYEYSKVIERNRELSLPAPPLNFMTSSRNFLDLSVRQQKLKSMTLTAIGADLESRNTLLNEQRSKLSRKNAAKSPNPYWLREGAAEFGKLSNQLRESIERLEPLSLRLNLLLQP